MQPVPTDTAAPSPTGAPRREMKFREFRGPTVQAAEQAARHALGDDLLGMERVRDVQSLSATAQARSPEDAAREAEKRPPQESIDRQPVQIIQEGSSGTAEVSEFDEREARKAWRRTAPRGGQIDEIICTSPPKNGIMGFGRRPGTWTVRWSAPYIAEVAYKMPAVVKARFFE